MQQPCNPNKGKQLPPAWNEQEKGSVGPGSAFRRFALGPGQDLLVLQQARSKF